MISDVVLPGVSGLELLAFLKAGDRERPVILITAYGTIDEAVEAMKAGAHDFLTKPLDYAKLRAALSALDEEIERRSQIRRLESALEKGADLPGFVGRSRGSARWPGSSRLSQRATRRSSSPARAVPARSWSPAPSTT